MESIGTWWLWTAFLTILIIVLGVDLYCFGGRSHHHRVTLKTSFVWSGVWIGLSFLFNAFLWMYLVQSATIQLANQKALEFFTAYVVEKALSLDNIFVFILIFKYFGIPLSLQRRLLLLGVLGAILCRLVFMAAGIWLLHQFEWIFYLFGLILLYSAVRMAFLGDTSPSIEKNRFLRFLQQVLPVKSSLSEEVFWIKSGDRYYLTPLFIVLIFIELSDLIFAVDSIPAVLGVTDDFFIAFTSNAFAILGLRALYFVLAHLQERFSSLRYGLVFILGFIGIKMLLHDVIHVPVALTLGVIVSALTVSFFIKD